MSIRLRLALCYGILFALILPMFTVLCYAIHARSQYDDLDRTLAVSAGHIAAEATISTKGLHLTEKGGNLEIVLRLYAPDGTLQQNTSDAEIAPTVEPGFVLQKPSGPAYDAIAGLFPPLTGGVTTPSNGHFGLISSSGQRWRIYVLSIQQTGMVIGYIEALTPLGRLDTSMQTFQIVLLILGLSSLVIALMASWAVAGKALRPIARMIQTIQMIAHSHDLSRRIETPAHGDELGRLATTFNEMLGSIETTYRGQQRFIADASHELRAPLTAIQGNLELLSRHQNMPEAERKEAVDEAMREANRMTRLVADLLSLARADAGSTLKRRPVDLDPIILDAFREAHHLAQGQTLLLEPFEPSKVEGNEDKLKQLLLILLDNALKYTPPDGQITVGLHRESVDAIMTVRDTGIGISAEDLPHVFDRLYRADPGRSRDPGGTGLGLSIARWIVEQHEGKITFESQVGHGTTVLVRIPLWL
jgi:two-component system, OmpR family, sensor kinase